MLFNLLKALFYSVSLGVSSFMVSGSIRDAFYFFYQGDYFGSEFSWMRLRLICFGLGVCVGIEKAFERVSLLKAFLLVAVPTWLSVSVCYELEIEPPNINLQAGITGILTGGMGMITPEAVNWGFMLLFVISLWVGEIVFIRADNTNGWKGKTSAVVLIIVLSVVFSLPAIYTVYDALAHASEYDDPLVLPDVVGFLIKHIAFPSLLASCGIAVLYALAQRLSPHGDDLLARALNWVIGASPQKEVERRGAQVSVDSSGVKRGEIMPPPKS